MFMLFQEKRKVEEEVEFQFDMQHAQEATYANMARDISNEVRNYSVYSFIYFF